jgi:hypothetical protein
VLKTIFREKFLKVHLCFRDSDLNKGKFLEDLIDEESSTTSDLFEDLTHQLEIGDLGEGIECENLSSITSYVSSEEERM